MDALLDGRVVLHQAAKGYRAGLDAALLAAACDAAAGSRVLDVGCGVGGVLLAAAWRRPGAMFTGIEKDAAAVDLARKNIEANDLGAVSIVPADVAAGFRTLDLPPFDAVLCNPPYFEDAASLRAPAPEKRDAWIAEDGLQAWIEFLLKAVREGGTLTIIHRADALADLLRGLAPKAGSFRVRPVQPFADAPAKRVLVRAVKTGKAPLVLLPPLVVHERGVEGHKAEVEAILRGTEALAWT